ncbi:MAG: DUF998 domain-containing protein [Thermoproteota archaeon]
MMKVYRLLGFSSALAAYPFILASIILSPWFNPYNNALSDLGNIARNGWVAYLYNFGLVFAGFLIGFFGVLVSMRYRSWRYLCWSILLTVAGFDLALIGFFPEDAGRIHMVVSTIFFISIILVMLAYGFCSKHLGSPAMGAAAFLLGFISTLVWIVEWPWRGVAIQETVASLSASTWLIMVLLQGFKQA